MKVELWFNRESATDQALIADAGGGAKRLSNKTAAIPKKQNF
jgi:hypothetical protein